jgi:hypothetical protein
MKFMVVCTLWFCFMQPAVVCSQTVGFVDVGPRVGLGVADGTAQSVGGSWGDFDGDGDLDVLITHWQQPMILFKQTATHKFENVSNTVGWEPFFGVGGVWGDYDNDGNLDLFVSQELGAPRLFRNKGGVDDYFRFENVSATLGDPLEDAGQSATWADYDNDGNLDIYVVNYGQENRLFRNNGQTFQDVAERVGVADFDNSLTGIWGDYDTDGDLDIYVVNRDQPNRLYRNDRDGFASVGFDVGVNDGGPGTGAAWGDFDNDNDLDLYVVNSSQANLLYRNEAGKMFKDVGPLQGVNNSGRGQNAAWGDYDNDGDVDLYLVNGGQGADIDYMYRNDTNRFTNASSVSGLIDAGAGTSASWADYDGDGDLDLLLIKNREANRLFQNQVGKNGVTIVLEGKKGRSNLQGIGARITVQTQTGTQRYDVAAGTGYLSQAGLPVVVGLGTAQIIDSLTVDWPARGNIKSVIKNIDVSELQKGRILVEDVRPQDIAVSHPIIEFEGSVEVDTKVSKHFWVSNSQTAERPLEITRVETKSPAFQLDPKSLTIGPNERKEIIVTFQPTAQGPYPDTLRIFSDDPDKPIVKIPLSARAFNKSKSVLVQNPDSRPKQTSVLKPTIEPQKSEDSISDGFTVTKGLEYPESVDFGDVNVTDPKSWPTMKMRLKNVKHEGNIEFWDPTTMARTKLNDGLVWLKVSDEWEKKLGLRQNLWVKTLRIN